MRLLLKFCILSFVVLPSQIYAEDGFSSLIESAIEDAVKNDNLLIFRRFQTETLDGILQWAQREAYCGDDMNARECADRQLDLFSLFTDELATEVKVSPNTRFNALYLETCGDERFRYGIGSVRNYSNIEIRVLIQRARIMDAFHAAGLSLEIDKYTVESFFWPYPAHQTTSIRSLHDLNSFLFAEYAEGRLSDVFQVIDGSDECGSGGLLVHVENPYEFSHLLIITEFLFKLCNVRNGNAWDTLKCPFWDPVNSENIWVSGAYRWQGVARSGLNRQGRFSIDGSLGGSSSIILR